jgi:hypothetical protein
MSSSTLRIAVTGLAGTYPFGGVFWDYMQYPLGLHRLGHDVIYIEDTGRWCYDPIAQTFVENGANNAEFLRQHISALEPELAERWFYRDASGTSYGLSWEQVTQFCRDADLFLHVSASCWMRDEYFAARQVVCIDGEPMYAQSAIPEYLAGTVDEEQRVRTERMRRHDRFFTFGENIGAQDCLIPTGLFDWMPTRQPIVLDAFDSVAVPLSARRRVLTTVSSWDSAEGARKINGVTYGGKGIEFERFLDLPARSPLPLELAMSGRAPSDRLRACGWNMVDGYAVSRDPWVYRDYLAHSFGEWSVAKHAYVASRSGWFSCRTACYLALGVPAVVQDTGFGRFIPTGEGLFEFRTVDEAADAIDRLLSAPERHSRAARALAEEFFHSDKVLSRLIEDSLNNSPRASSAASEVSPRAASGLAGEPVQTRGS